MIEIIRLEQIKDCICYFESMESQLNDRTKTLIFQKYKDLVYLKNIANNDVKKLIYSVYNNEDYDFEMWVFIKFFERYIQNLNFILKLGSAMKSNAEMFDCGKYSAELYCFESLAIYSQMVDFFILLISPILTSIQKKEHYINPESKRDLNPKNPSEAMKIIKLNNPAFFDFLNKFMHISIRNSFAHFDYVLDDQNIIHYRSSLKLKEYDLEIYIVDLLKKIPPLSFLLGDIELLIVENQINFYRYILQKYEAKNHLTKAQLNTEFKSFNFSKID